MKTILLMRHAKSNWDDADLDDFDRPLAKRGLEDAPRMGKTLAKLGCLPDTIVSCTACRALQTAELFAKGAGWKGCPAASGSTPRWVCERRGQRTP